MLKHVLFISLFFISFLIKAQTDTSKLSTNNSIASDTLPKKKKEKTPDAPPALGDVIKPKISLGVGMLSFHGDLYAKHYQAPWTARIGYDLNISQRLFKSVQLNFNILFGK